MSHDFFLIAFLDSSSSLHQSMAKFLSGEKPHSFGNDTDPDHLVLPSLDDHLICELRDPIHAGKT